MVSIYLSWVPLIPGFVKPEVNLVNLVVILLFSVQRVESLLGGISALRVITKQLGMWGPVAVA